MIKSNFNRTMLALATACALSTPVTGLAQPAPAAFNLSIPALSLGDALNELARQTGVELGFPANLVAGRTAPAVSGQLSLQQALDSLLAGTDLVADINGNQVWVKQNPAYSGVAVNTQQAGNKADGVADLPTIRVQGNSIFTTPGPVHRITREDLDRKPYSRIGDMFDGIPGVAASGGANAAGLQINIRGLQGHGRVKTLIDGTMQSASTYKGYPGNREDTYVDPDLIAGIEIKKGPDAGPQGASVVGGVVSMRTIDARDIIVDPDKNWGLRVRGMYGNNVADSEWMEAKVINRYQSSPESGYFTYDTYRINRGTGRNGTQTRQSFNNGVPKNKAWVVDDDIDFGGGIPDKNYSGSIAGAWRPTDNLEFTAAYAKRQSGNYYAGERGVESWHGLRSSLAGKEVYNTSINSETYLLKSKLSFLDEHTWEVGYIDYRNQAGFANTAANAESDYEWQQQLGRAESKTYTSLYSWRPDSPWIDLRWNLWKADLKNDNSMFTVTGNKVTIDSKNLGSELWNTSKLVTPLGDLSLKYGVSYAREKASGDIDAKEYQDYVIRTALVNAERKTYGAFVNADYQPFQWMTVNAGLQYSKTKYRDHKGSVLDYYGGYMQAQPDRSISSLNPSLGLTFQPHEAVQIYAMWSQGERAPSLREMYIETNGVKPNPSLDSEKADNLEYGMNLSLGNILLDRDRLGVKISRFHNNYKNYIARMDRRAMGERPETGWRYKFFNIDKAKYEGYELTLDYDANWIYTKFSLAYFDKVRYCYPGYEGNTQTPSVCHHQPPQTDFGAGYVPPKIERFATLGFRLLERKLEFGATMKSSSASMYGGSFRGSYVGKTVWDKYTVYDVFASYRPTKNIELGLSIENITDRFYVPSYSDSLTALPAPGRTAKGTMTITF